MRQHTAISSCEAACCSPCWDCSLCVGSHLVLDPMPLLPRLALRCCTRPPLFHSAHTRRDQLWTRPRSGPIALLSDLTLMANSNTHSSTLHSHTDCTQQTHLGSAARGSAQQRAPPSSGATAGLPPARCTRSRHAQRRKKQQHALRSRRNVGARGEQALWMKPAYREVHCTEAALPLQR